MNTHYTKEDVVELASTIFVNDINSESVAESGIETESLAEAAFFAAEVFFMKAAAYHRGELDLVLGACHNRGELTNESSDQRKGERRQGERRGADKPLATGADKPLATDPCETSPEEDEAFARLEQALKAQFLMATLSDIFRNAEHKG